MNNKKIKSLIAISSLIVSSAVFADSKQESNIRELVKGVNTYQIEIDDLDVTIPTKINHSFDVNKEIQFNNALRYLDMHLEAGVKPENIKVAIVVRGRAVESIVKGKSNKVLSVLLNSGLVDIYVCGQTLTDRGYEKSDLRPEIKLSLSAMTAHHYLQQKGYSYNPF